MMKITAILDGYGRGFACSSSTDTTKAAALGNLATDRASAAVQKAPAMRIRFTQ